ncbi:Phosphotransferase enzyme family protein [Stieleria neptunia]|uniref:Phosphotransferase enzyme family protein n=1 Tax=Stieleria neptunia TaxID=2527979 RepID=A0A518HI13_9BACT|nr:aminoglycoside phosphotransferase family protein [Stieleria neptunia]QDV40439.1 Phosphotransferase enzyme family protein [Stieleria neptunia]
MIPAEIRSGLQRQGVTSITPLPPGFSGARVFRCSGSETLVLRCWPDGTAVERVHEIHSVVSAVASTLELLPQYKPIDPHGSSLANASLANASLAIDAAGRIWELATWMPGQPLEDDAPLRSIGEGAVAIAHLHDALGRLGRWHQPAPAIAERLQRLAWLNQHLPGCLATDLDGRVHPSVAAALVRACRLLQQRWPTTAPRLTRALTPLADQEFPLQYVLRDIHREHMLFSAEKVVGIIDFDALRVDTVAVDLARWATSFSQFRIAPAQTIDRILADYRPTTPLFRQSASRQFDAASAADPTSGIPGSGLPKSGIPELDAPEFRTLVLTLAETSLWISLANWVVWLVGESRQFPDLQLVSRRLDRLIESVDGPTKR